MFKRITKIKPIKIVVILLALNLSFFSASSYYFNNVNYPVVQSGENVSDNEYIESGWKLVNWSIGMYRFFKGNKPKNI
jgi:hypothetical protein